MRLMTLEELAAWFESHGQILIVCAGSILALILAAMLWRRVRNSSVAKVGRFVAGPLVLGWEAQGLYQVGTQLLNLPWYAALPGAGVTAAVLIALGGQAHEHYKRHGVLGPNGRMMLYVAIPMGLIVALGAHTSVEAGLRIVMPLLAYIVFRSEYLPDEPAGVQRKRGSFRWNPRRIGVQLGLFDPTDADITVVHRAHRVQMLIRLSRKAHRSWLLRGWYTGRLQKHSELADDGMLAEVVAGVTRSDLILELTDPSTTRDRLVELAGNIAARRLAIAATAAPGAEPEPCPDVRALPGHPSGAVVRDAAPDAAPVPVRTPPRSPLPHPVQQAPLPPRRPDGGSPGRPDATPYVASRRPPRNRQLDEDKDRAQLELIARSYPDLSWDQMREGLNSGGRQGGPSQSEMEEMTGIRRPRIKQLLLGGDGLAESYFPHAGAGLPAENLDLEMETLGELDEEEVPKP